MLIGNKLFPYPTLNRNPDFSDYKSQSTFAIAFDTQDDGELIRTKTDIILKNVHFELSDTGLEALFTGGYVECAMIIECSASMFRKKYTIRDLHQDISITIGDLSGNVYVSAFMYATQAINNYSNPQFLDDYTGYEFEIDKYDILAVDDGYKFNIDTNPDSDNKVSSIFTIVKQNNAGMMLGYQSTLNRINITLSPEYYSYYDNLKNTSDFNNIMFAMLAIPVLTGCIYDIKNGEYSDIEDIYETQRWFKAVCMSYKRETGKELTLDELNDLNPVELAQIVLNNSTCNGLKDFNTCIVRGSQNMGFVEEQDE